MPSDDIESMTKGTTFDRSGDYKIGPADQLAIKVYGDESLSGTFVVGPSGTIQFPLVGAVPVQGFTQAQVAQRLEQLLKPYLKSSRVIVSQAAAQSYRIFFSGEFAAKGVKELGAKTTVLQGITLGGGLTDFATGKIYIIRRYSENDVRRFQVYYPDLLRGKKSLDFIYLERDDILVAE
jgi:polysaccharide export outer membrane protein